MIIYVLWVRLRTEDGALIGMRIISGYQIGSFINLFTELNVRKD